MSRDRGRHGEKSAEQALRRHGLETLERNYRCRWGEIDLVMLDGRCTVFVEVRLRKSGAMVSAVESVGARKQQRLIRASRHYLMTHPVAEDRPARYDVVAISETGGDNELHWLKDAFRP